MANLHRRRRLIFVAFMLVLFAVVVYVNFPKNNNQVTTNNSKNDNELAINVLKQLSVKGRAPKTGYTRAQFGDSWRTIGNCDMRNIILNRDMTNVKLDDQCHVLSGDLDDPYTGKLINFKRGADTSSSVQIDHVVALSDAWQKGAQQLSSVERLELANDPLELLAVDGMTNQNKSDGDAATWLPPNKAFRCQYVARQVAVKQKYKLWVTQAEFDAINKTLETCPGQRLPLK